MRKVQVFLRDDQKTALKAISGRTGQKQSDLIRRSVDLLIESSKAEDAAWREATRAAAGIWSDRSDPDEGFSDFREAARRRFGSASERT